MKNTFTKVLALVAIFAAFTMTNVTTTVQAKDDKVVVEVKNLYCKICAGGVRSKLQKVDKSVASVKQSFDGKTGKAVYTIKLKRGEAVPDSMIQRIVKESGGTVRTIKRQDKS